MATVRVRHLGALGLVVMVGLAAGAASEPATGSRLAADAAQASPKIVFVSRSRAGGGPPLSNKLYVINADGSGRQLLTSDAWTATPAWSPNPSPGGQRVAFLRHRRGAGYFAFDLYDMNADGGSVRLRAHGADGGAGPAWSPRQPYDGQGWSQIAVLRPVRGVPQLYVMNADGSLLRRRARTRVAGPICWSPDGRTIAFVGEHDGNLEIYAVNPEGGGPLRNLTRNPGDDFAPAWSPDGRKIGFTSDRDGNTEIYVMNADGTGQRNLSGDPLTDVGPAWSPDGRKIAFVSDRDGNTEIYVMNADGSGQRRLTRNTAGDYGPAWSPDGTMIAFVSQRDGHVNHEIYVMKADGSGQRNLTRTGAQEDWFAWSPGRAG